MRDAGIKQYFATMKPPAATVSTVVVKPSEWTPGVEAIGTVNAVRGVDLTVETSGIVKNILFHANQKVATDAVLLQLDDAVEKADLVAQKAQAASDQAALTRAIELQRRGVGTDATLDAARAAADASAAQVNKLQAVLDQKQLSAPFGGTVGIPKIDIGQYLAPGNSVVTIQDLDTMRVDFTVPEQQLPLLKIGQTVKLGSSLADMSFAGSIRGIDPKIDPASRLVSIRGEVANPEGKLTPGQFVQIRVELPQEDNVISVPQTAVTTSLYGDYVFVVVPAKPAEGAAAAPAKPDEQKATADAAKPQADASKPADNATKPADAKPADAAQQQAFTISQIFVKLGRRNNGMVEIVEGLKDGDQVVTAGQNRLFNGMSVAVDNTIDPSKSANKEVQQ
ncbi:MAG: efflux RND transporter periplasmic adaptor subunit [Mesorhizobium sp.]|nr:efflux RND transporter periplasmic adaptor subunit [Mesorhizobium sp. M2A.F.Ca.ET.043.02.1.1]AZO39502.1 efflux RND transporter periplasmic adaptor subunit [Mesorhizobium sp. M2A.F.Ca.ET.046.03.2.1]RUW40331.1 efflux RND transporter periplasmic adaptor subunit [Mesorhizobium sp. M2A.F.Ca.ET.015.02.1.1]RUW77351.1 efflux RND transporter periplasmic adaptor subunit [Mesorhizobium sp. M2A.F.Ca.ET.067.02.1.1]RUY11109.1 efflux RND transporter periplasmic adaptor subunit [Mesorhizobium sp. M2A.F.Ca.E